MVKERTDGFLQVGVIERRQIVLGEEPGFQLRIAEYLHEGAERRFASQHGGHRRRAVEQIRLEHQVPTARDALRNSRLRRSEAAQHKKHDDGGPWTGSAGAHHFCGARAVGSCESASR